MIRNRVLLFWTLIFPMLLTTFFGMVLKDAYTVDTFQTVPIAVVEQKDLSQLKAVLKDVRQGDTALFKVSYVGEEQAKQLLKEDKVDAAISRWLRCICTVHTDSLSCEGSEHGSYRSVLRLLLYSPGNERHVWRILGDQFHV